MKPVPFLLLLGLTASTALAQKVPPSNDKGYQSMTKAAEESKLQYDRLESKVNQENKDRVSKSEELTREKEREAREAQSQQMKKYEEVQREQERIAAYQKKLQDLSTQMRQTRAQAAKHGADEKQADQRYQQLYKEYNETFTEWHAKQKPVSPPLDANQRNKLLPPVPQSGAGNSGFDD